MPSVPSCFRLTVALSSFDVFLTLLASIKTLRHQDSSAPVRNDRETVRHQKIGAEVSWHPNYTPFNAGCRDDNTSRPHLTPALSRLSRASHRADTPGGRLNQLTTWPGERWDGDYWLERRAYAGWATLFAGASHTAQREKTRQRVTRAVLCQSIEYVDHSQVKAPSCRSTCFCDVSCDSWSNKEYGHTANVWTERCKLSCLYHRPN